MKEITEEQKKELYSLIDDGLIIEDEIIKVYANALKYNDFFDKIDPDVRSKLENYIDVLVYDTKKHISFLEKIKNNFK